MEETSQVLVARTDIDIAHKFKLVSVHSIL